LERVIAFVNTLDLETGVEELATVVQLRAWLGEHDLPGVDGALGEAERRQAIELREALRALMLEHNGHPPTPATARTLERLARRARLIASYAPGGNVVLEPFAPGFPGALGQLLLTVARASQDGSWQRVKACRADGCQWAFYDRSRNRSGVWCEMAVCGNRTKVRAHRRREPGVTQAASG
jgi:predicted RNA-binding Zn ribbon-like protein